MIRNTWAGILITLILCGFGHADPIVVHGTSRCERFPSLCSTSVRHKDLSSDALSSSQAAATPAGAGGTTGPSANVGFPARSARKGPRKASGSKEASTRPGQVGAGDEARNLPNYYIATNGLREDYDEDIAVVPERIIGAELSGLKAGDELEAVLEQSIKASPSVPTPIRAQVTSGRFRGAYFLGTATLDRELKRIVISFERMRLPGQEVTYTVKASGLAPNGQVGLEGDFHSQEGLYFAGEVLSATAAGYADATTQRYQNLIGNYEVEPSVGNAAKQGAVSALSKTADHFAERSRNAPEYTEIEGGREIRIIVQENPREAD